MSRTLSDLALLAGVSVAAAAIAGLAGAANAGVALTFGELAFVAALIWLLLTRD